jgi:hypothetical protein
MSRTNDKRFLFEKGRIKSSLIDAQIFGSVEFVRETAFALGDRFRSRSVAARAVGELGFATHGWRLAKESDSNVA